MTLISDFKLSVWNILYGFLIFIDSVIYKTVGWLYQIYLMVADARIFTSDVFESFTQRIYAILGVVMLFVLAYSLLQSIVDPDKNDVGGTGKIITNTIISIILIAVIPTVFNFLYYAQGIIMGENTIGKLILGSYSTAANKSTINFSNDICEKINDSTGTEDGSCQKQYKTSGNTTSLKYAGNSIAVDVFSAFFYPNIAQKSSEQSETIDTSSLDGTSQMYTKIYSRSMLEDEDVGDVDFNKESNDLAFAYSYAYSVCSDTEGIYNSEGDASNLKNTSDGYVYGQPAMDCANDVLAAHGMDFDDQEFITYKGVLNYAKSEGDYSGFKLLSHLIYNGDISYTWMISTIAGGFICYIFVSYCIDMGLRAAKLGFAQLIAPVPILARIVPSQDGMFNNWVSFSLKSYYEVFLRIAVVFLGVFMITNLPDIGTLLGGLWSDTSYTTISVMSLRMPLLLNVNASWGVINFARAIIIIGILMFIKEAPTLINEALGISISTGSLNIRNKLKNMVGGERLAKGASFAAGAATGAIGAGYMSKKNGGKFFSAALKGGHDGAKAGGWQLGKQGQQAYRDVTGDKYDGSFLPFGNRSIGGIVNAKYDNMNKENQKFINENQKKIVSEFEDSYKNTKNFQDAFAAKKSKEKNADAYNAINEDYKNAVYSAQGALQQAKSQADQYKVNEAEAIKNRKEAFENSAKYNTYMAIARGAARAESNYANMTADEQRKVIMQKFKEAAAKDSASEVQAYLKDLDRDVNEEADQMVREATKQFNIAAKKAQDARESAVKDLNSKLEKEVFKDIENNPHGAKEREYSNAKSGIKRRGDLENDKEIRRAFADFYNKKDDK